MISFLYSTCTNHRRSHRCNGYWEYRSVYNRRYDSFLNTFCAKVSCSYILQTKWRDLKFKGRAHIMTSSLMDSTYFGIKGKEDSYNPLVLNQELHYVYSIPYWYPEEGWNNLTFENMFWKKCSDDLWIIFWSD